MKNVKFWVDDHCLLAKPVGGSETVCQGESWQCRCGTASRAVGPRRDGGDKALCKLWDGDSCHGKTADGESKLLLANVGHGWLLYNNTLIYHEFEFIKRLHGPIGVYKLFSDIVRFNQLQPSCYVAFCPSGESGSF